MKGKYKIALGISMVINIFLVATFFFIFRNGYYNKLMKPYINKYYRAKVSHFKTLNQEKAEIVFIGDSLTDRCEWSELLERKEVANRGIDSDTTDGILNRISDVTSLKPRKVFIMIGINDLCYQKSIDYIANNYQKIIKQIKKEIPGAQIYMQSLLPTVHSMVPIPREDIIELNKRIQQLSDNRNIFYVNINQSLVDKHGDLKSEYTCDGAHLNGEGYVVWKETLRKYLD
jgi:lysophospholipase L1-like esterase